MTRYHLTFAPADSTSAASPEKSAIRRFMVCRMTPFKGRFSRSAKRESLIRSARKVLRPYGTLPAPRPYAVFNAPDGAPYIGVEEGSIARLERPPQAVGPRSKNPSQLPTSG